MQTDYWKQSPKHGRYSVIQESPAVADKPARRESMPKIAPIRRAYNVVADNTDLASFVLLLAGPKSVKSREILWKFKLIEFKVI